MYNIIFLQKGKCFRRIIVKRGLDMAESTKIRIAESLKELLARKPLEKLTVSDISNNCGVNRQTFYYYFHDVYDLIEWILLSEGRKLFSDRRNRESWQDGFLEIFSAMKENSIFVRQTYRSHARENLEKILLEGAETIILQILATEEIPLSREDAAFIAGFYKHAFAGIVLDWIGSDMKGDPAVIVKKVEMVMASSLSENLRRFSVNAI